MYILPLTFLIKLQGYYSKQINPTWGGTTGAAFFTNSNYKFVKPFTVTAFAVIEVARTVPVSAEGKLNHGDFIKMK